MKKTVTWIALTVSLVMIVSSCGSSNKGGASSPEKLFAQMKETDRSNFSSQLDLVVPEERPILAFSLDFIGAFATAFSPDKSLKKEYQDIRSKHGLKDMSKSKPKVNMKDPDSVIKYAQETYGDIDLKGFLSDMAAFIDKLPGKSKVQKSQYRELKNLKVEGDQATATAVLENGKEEEIFFKKADGRWYLSAAASMK